MKNKQLHPRNKHQQRYNFERLTQRVPALSEHLQDLENGEKTINFFDPLAVKLLNKALLDVHYDIKDWDIPEGFLCPPIPSRADYIHHAADMLKKDFHRIKGNQIHCLDIGTGANCIYPLLGNAIYHWSFTATDINPVSVAAARQNLRANPQISKKVEVVQQEQTEFIFKNIIQHEDRFDIVLCNPPFHPSKKDAERAAQRKLNNLKGKKERVKLNFGGQQQELWTKGGELKFIEKMILESQLFKYQALWYSSLVSRKDNLPIIRKILDKVEVKEYHIVEMQQGNKQSRIIFWTFLDKKQRHFWARQKH